MTELDAALDRMRKDIDREIRYANNGIIRMKNQMRHFAAQLKKIISIRRAWK